jgi:hypothetical protein
VARYKKHLEEMKNRPRQLAYLGVDDGKFEVTLDGVDGKTFSQRKPDIISADPEVIRAFLVDAHVTSIMCSSSVDFPEEYGMDPEKVQQLFGE